MTSHVDAQASPPASPNASPQQEPPAGPPAEPPVGPLLGALSAVSETLLIPLYFRALEAKHPRPIVFDPAALAIVNRLDYDFTRFDRIGPDRVFTLMRCREFDRQTRVFLEAHPNGTVVEIGCGLDDRLSRIDPNRTARVHWHDLDLPAVMALRSRLPGFESRGTPIAASVLDPGWLAHIQVETGARILFLAEGVLPYFPETDVRRLIQMLREAFPGCEIVFDALTSRMVRLHSRGSRLKDALNQVRWSLDDDRGLESWADGIRHLETWHYFDQPEPRLGVVSLLRFIPSIALGTRILHYRLGNAP